MGDIDKIIREATDFGFTYAGPLDCSTIVLRQEVRDMCEVNRCGMYGKSWNCPPGCGSLEECAERVKRFSRGIIVQVVGELEDEFDFEGIQAASAKYKEAFYSFTARLRQDYPGALALGAGGCRYCDTCSYPDAPCRHPELAVSSMESYGMVVSDVCKANGMAYYYGKGTQVFVGCYLID